MLLASLILLSTLSDAPNGQTGIMGYWERSSKAVLWFYPCGSEACAKIVRLSPTSTRKTDSRNPDTSLRGRPLCGLDVGTGFRQVDANHLVGGHLYDPVTGKTYSGMASSDGDEVKLRGFVGIPWLGKSEVWHRVSPVSAMDCK